MQDKIMTSVEDEPYFYVQTGSNRIQDSRVDSVVYYFPSNRGFIEVDPSRMNSFIDFVDRKLEYMTNKLSTAMHAYDFQGESGILEHNNIRYYSLQALQEYFNITNFNINNINKENLRKKSVRELERILCVIEKEKEKRNEKSCCS